MGRAGWPLFCPGVCQDAAAALGSNEPKMNFLNSNVFIMSGFASQFQSMDTMRNIKVVPGEVKRQASQEKFLGGFGRIIAALFGLPDRGGD